MLSLAVLLQVCTDHNVNIFIIFTFGKKRNVIKLSILKMLYESNILITLWKQIVETMFLFFPTIAEPTASSTVTPTTVEASNSTVASTTTSTAASTSTTTQTTQTATELTTSSAMARSRPVDMVTFLLPIT